MLTPAYGDKMGSLRYTKHDRISLKAHPEILGLISKTATPQQNLNYNKHYVGLTDGTRSRNFIYFRPRRQFLRVIIPDGWNEGRAARFDEAGLEAEQSDDKLVFNLSSSDLTKHRALIETVIDEVVAEQSS
jgi:hypothetical protein